MDRHLKAHLYDIATAIDEIHSFFDQVQRRLYCPAAAPPLLHATEKTVSSMMGKRFMLTKIKFSAGYSAETGRAPNSLERTL